MFLLSCEKKLCKLFFFSIYKILPSYFSRTHEGRVPQIGKALKKYLKKLSSKKHNIEKAWLIRSHGSLIIKNDFPSLNNYVCQRLWSLKTLLHTPLTNALSTLHWMYIQVVYPTNPHNSFKMHCKAENAWWNWMWQLHSPKKYKQLSLPKSVAFACYYTVSLTRVLI